MPHHVVAIRTQQICYTPNVHDCIAHMIVFPIPCGCPPRIHPKCTEAQSSLPTKALEKLIKKSKKI